MRRLLAATETVAAFFLLAIALLTAGNVTLRTVGQQLPDWFDLSRMLLGIAMFWGMSLAVWRGSHIAVDVVWEHLGPSNRRRMDIVATAISLLFFAPLAWMVWVKVAGTGTQGTMDLRLPLVWFYAVAALGAVAAAVLAAARLVHFVRGRPSVVGATDGASLSEPTHGP
ncbi:MAG: TRAP transporter small permease subunit [Hyphomicrobium sp.]|nr:TRAP transporter small permease subunit [Hyphomicrobium sp.]